MDIKIPWLDPVHPRLIYPLESVTRRLDMAVLFPLRQELQVELGSGDGSFIAQYARQNRNVNFIALERLLGRARKVERKGLRAGLINLCVLRIEATYFVKYLLPLESVSAFHIYFPDPWPKKRHHRNRLINSEFTHALRGAMATSGKVFIRTDDTDYHTWILDAFASNPDFEAVPTPPELSSLRTDFEVDFNTKGIPTLYAAYQKKR